MRYLALFLFFLVVVNAADDRRPLVLSATNQPTQFPNGDTLRVAPRQGTDAAKGAAASYAKCIYLATDTLKIYVSDGATWSEISPSSTEFADNVFEVYDESDDTKKLVTTLGNQTTGTTVTLNTGAQTANRQVSLPVMTGDRTLAVIDQAQTFSANQTITADWILSGDRSIKLGANTNFLSVLGGTAANADPNLQMFGSSYPSLGGRVYLDTSRLVVRGLNAATTGVVELIGTAAATSTGTGSLINAGGFGNGGAGYFGGNIVAGASSSDTYTGQFSGNAGTNILAVGGGANAKVQGFTNAFSAINLQLQPNGGEVLVAGASDAGAYALQVNGSTYGIGSTVIASANDLVLQNSANDSGSTISNGGASGAGVIQMFTSGVEKVRIKNDGEVLLGTTTDSGAYRLQVNGASYLGGNAYIPNQNYYRGITTTGVSDRRLIGTDANDDVAIDPDATGSVFGGFATFPAATTSLTSIRIPHGTAPSSPTNGDIWTTTSGIYVRVNGSTVGPLSTGGAGSSPSFKFSGRNTMSNIGASSTAETSFLPTTTTGSATFGANTLTEGSIVRCTMTGFWSVSGTPSVTIKAKFGSTVLSNSGAVASPSGMTGRFQISWQGVVRSTGGSGTILAEGSMPVWQSAYGDTVNWWMNSPSNSPVTIDTTASNALDFTVQYSASHASNYVTIYTCTVEHILP